MVKKKLYKGKQPQQQQKGGSTFQKRPFGGMFANTFSRIKFIYCGKNGHQAKFCFKRQTDEARNKQRKHTRYFLTEGHSHDLRLFVVDCALSASEEDEDDIWYVDSGASSHMTGKRNWFEIF